MKIREKIEYGLVRGLLVPCRALPESWIYALFRTIGKLADRALKRRRKLALRNTEIAFPTMPEEERKKLVRQHFINLAESMALNALITSGRISNERIFEMVEVENWEIFETACQNSSKGLLAFSAHLGNWELMPQYIALHKKTPIHIIARKSNNPLIEERIVMPLRKRFGVNILYKKNALLRIVQAARRKELSGLLIDQKLNPPNGVPINFFGRPAGTTITPALLQIRFGLSLVPMFMVRTGPCKYRLIIRPPVEWTDNGKPQEEQAKELTRLHQEVIENIIREYPNQWFWVHNRWGLKKNEP
ncbi:MAG: lysophospholipid acyltransferase family protein [Pontiellaceae bacterium]|nr:lysophospholipid acyltransferase family protein [Pontiellaceae bacterium]